MKPVQPRARKERLLVRTLADEVLVYDLERHTAACLNRTAAAVWRRCDGATDLDAIARAVAAEIDAPFDTRAAWCALDGLEKRALIEPLGEVESRPTRTRREWLRELGQAGLSGMLIPAVLAVVAPSAAEAASYISSSDCKMLDPADCGGARCTDGPGGYCLRVVTGKKARCICVP